MSAGRRPHIAQSPETVRKLDLVLGSEALDAVAPVKSLSDCLVCLNKDVELLGELLVLSLQDPNVVIKRLHLGLRLLVALKQVRALDA